MPTALIPAQREWLHAFTGGSIDLPKPEPSGQDDLDAAALEHWNRTRLEAQQAKELAAEQKRKQVLLAKAFAVLDRSKKDIRTAFDMQVKTYVDEAQAKKGEKGKKQTQNLQGKQTETYDAAESDLLTEVSSKHKNPAYKPGEALAGKVSWSVNGQDPSKLDAGDEVDRDWKESDVDWIVNKTLNAVDAMKAMSVLVEQKDLLAKETVDRTVAIDEHGKFITKPAPLFSDKELMDELYSPLVRDQVMPETFIPDRYSAVQQMIDQTNDYYLKECKTKGKPVATGASALAKGAINLGAQVADTIIGGLAPVAAGQQGLATSGMIDQDSVARYKDITDGVAMLLTTVGDVADAVADYELEFSTSAFGKIMTGLATGIGKAVAGGLGNVDAGLAVTDGLLAGSAVAELSANIIKWHKSGGTAPVADMLNCVGKAIGSALSAAGDQTSDMQSNELGGAAALAPQLFAKLADAWNDRLGDAFRTGDWKVIRAFFAKVALDIGQQMPVVALGNPAFNAIDGSADGGYSKQDKFLAANASLNEGMSRVSEGFAKLGEAVDEERQQKGIGAPSKREQLEKTIENSNEKQIEATKEQAEAAEKQKQKQEILAELEEEKKELAEEKHQQPAAGKKKHATPQEIEQKFAAKEKEIEEKITAATQKELLDDLARERAEYQKSLNSLNQDPEADNFKSIQRLIDQLEKDQKIWNGVTAIVGGTIAGGQGLAVIEAVANTVAPPLAAANQLLKFCKNLQAASDRCSAWLGWREGRKDAVSAVSPYETAIDNFVQNQGRQFTHYSIQMAANVIQAFMKAGQLGPLAPAFKIADSAVGAGAALEEVIYKFISQKKLAAAWKETKHAFEPRNRKNRKMQLLLRQINPTLAKYTIAYGAMIEKSPIAITMCTRLKIDRETLANEGQNVGLLKTYLEKLYNDDGKVVGVMETVTGKTQVPTPALTTKAWALSHALWKKHEKLATANPPLIVGSLAIIERLAPRRAIEPPADNALSPKERTELTEALRTLWIQFRAFAPVTENGVVLPEIAKVVRDYVILAENDLKLAKIEIS